MTDVILRARGISKSYEEDDGSARSVLEGLDLEVRRGSLVVIRGDNGSGKSTLLRILGLVDRECEGYLEICGTQVAGEGQQLSEAEVEDHRAKHIGFVFQDDLLLPLLTLWDNSALPARIHRSPKAGISEYLERLTELVFHELGSDPRVLQRRRTSVSGGQRQRAAILRALSHRPSLILADEPTASLDLKAKKEVVQVFKKLCEEKGATILIVSHDPIFDDVGETYELSDKRLAPAVSVSAETRPPTKIERLRGCPPSLLAKIALLEARGNPLFAIMIGAAMAAGLFQLTVLWSIRAGTENVLDEVINKGSRLNRLTVEASRRSAEGATPGGLPSDEILGGLEAYRHTVPRRETLLRLEDRHQRERRETAFGLISDDPELEKLELRDGAPFDDQQALAVLISERSVERLFGKSAAAVGKEIRIRLRRYHTKDKEDYDEKAFSFAVQGVVDRAEAGRNLYLPQGTLMAIAKWRLNLETELVESNGRLVVEGIGGEAPIWERLHIYFDRLDQVLPAATYLEQEGFSIAAEILKYKWVLDTKRLVSWMIIGVFAMVVLITGLLIVSNVISGVRLKRKEIAILKLMGMKDRDVVSIFVLSVLLCALVGGALGFGSGSGVVDGLRDYLSGEYPETPLGQVLTSTWDQFGNALLLCAAVAILFTVYPAWRTARKEAVWKLN